jgi:hypothetical protein
MRVLWRNKKARLCCADLNGWAATVGQAFDFTSVAHATKFALDDQRKPGLARTLALPGLGFEREPPVYKSQTWIYLSLRHGKTRPVP